MVAIAQSIMSLMGATPANTSGPQTKPLGMFGFAALLNPNQMAAVQSPANTAVPTGLLEDAQANPLLAFQQMAADPNFAKAFELAGEVADLLGVADINLPALVAGDAATLEGLALSPEDETDLMALLSNLQNTLRDLLDAIPDFAPTFHAILTPFVAPQEQAAMPDVSVQSLEAVKTPATLGAVAPQLPQAVRPLLANAGLGTPSLALAGEMQDLGLTMSPREQILPLDTLSPQAEKILQVMTAAVAQSGAGGQSSLDFEASETPLALAPVSKPDATQPLFEPVAQAQSPKDTSEQQAKFANAIVNQVRGVELHEGTTRIELSPRGLGSMEIELRTKEDGTLSVVVRAENHGVLTTLRQEHDLLAAVIAQNEGSSLEFQEFDRNTDEQNTGSGPAQSGVSSDELEDEPQSERGPILTGSTLDLVT